MRRQRRGAAPLDRDAENGWEVAQLLGGPTLDGVRLAGFRDRAAVGLDMQVLPRPAVVVVIGLGDDHPLTVESAAGHRPMRSFVGSLSPGPAHIRGEGVTCVEVCLAPPAAHALLGVSPRELDGSVTALDDLWGRQARLLHERLTDATTWQERLALTDAFLTRRAAGAPSVSPEVAAAWDTIVARRGRIRVADLAASFGWSRKRLWSRFTDQIGLTPKRAAMLVRFDHAVRALHAGESAGDVALACGYADQPHLHRDVLALAGCTPGALAGRATSAT
ncbi:AraC family transcriptional regulator [Streptomyces sp. SM11]|uniref:helix-turn-helix domain-containing protein n=1 Tax=Streptomyces sp. SM11 TaxID=565557 RepID=UPI000CD58879|nr:AraC family transcriptional regulator [Streptomyces sp. SM11]